MRWKFFSLGLGVTGLSLALAWSWDDLVVLLLREPYLAYDRQPAWVKAIQQGLGHLPWLVGGLLLVLKWRGYRRVQLGSYALGAFLPPALFAAYVFAEPPLSNWWHHKPFDAAGWRAPADTAPGLWPTRLRMVDDLLARRLLPGLSPDSVSALLGPADRGALGLDSTVAYYLGPERGWLRIDSEELIIRFDASGRVQEARIVRD